MLPTTTSITSTTHMETTFYCQDAGNVQNSERFGIACAQLNSTYEAHSFPSDSFMPQPYTHMHSTSYYPQSYDQTLQSPYMYLPDNVAPLTFPAYPYQVEGSGTPNLGLGGFPNVVHSNGHAGDMAQSTCSMQPVGLSEFQEQRKLHSLICKAARSKRKMARQMSASLQIKPSGGCSSSSLPSSSIRNSRTLGKRAASQKGNNTDQENLYTICTQDNKKLRVLLQKELTSSDVGTLGRIVLPKREAEDSLPILYSKEGIIVVIKDVYSNQEWQMRYRFWANHKGRMYILDQFGDFVNQNRMETGDHLTIYEDKSKNLYFSINKKEKPAPPPNEQNNAYRTYISAPFTKEATEEEDFSLKILMEDLKHTEHPEANNLMTLYTDSAASFHSRLEEGQ